MRPKTTIIYCLKNPIDRNIIFYVGRTTLKLNVRLLAHINKPTNTRMASILASIKIGGKMPVIQELEICEGYLQPMQRERFWYRHYNKRKYKLANAPFSKKVSKASDRVF